MMVGNLQPGIFYDDSQKIYFLETPPNTFVDEYTYKLNVNVPDKNLNFNAQTDLVNGTALIFDFLSKITLQLNGFRCADNDLATTDGLKKVVSLGKTKSKIAANKISVTAKLKFSSIEKSSMYYSWLTMDKLIKIQLKLLRENKCILEYTHDSTPIPTNTNQQVSIQLSSMIYDGVENIVHCMQFIA